MASGNASTIRLGAQTNAWAIDSNRIETLYAVLDRIRELGLSGFETGFRNFESSRNDLAPVRERFRATGLTFFGIHIFLPEYDKETHIAGADLCEKVLETGAALDTNNLILSGSPCESETHLQKKASALNQMGSLAVRKGMRVAYHNHGPEFANQQREIRFLMKHTDPERVSFVLDAGHAFRAGADVPAFLSEYSKRIVGVHLRDSKSGREVPLGEGEFPLAASASILRQVHWNGWALLEEERADGGKPGDAAIMPAFEGLQRAFAS